MEAKGCAKPAVWKEARRHFYWTVRGRITRSTALASLATASPDSTFEYRVRLLDSLACLETTSSPREVAEKLEKLDLNPTITKLKADHLTRRLIELAKEDRKATLEGILLLMDHLTDDERTTLIGVLQNSPLTRKLKHLGDIVSFFLTNLNVFVRPSSLS